MNTVLLIEDDEILSGMYQKKLGERYAVTHVRTGREAVDAAVKNPPSLVLLDIMLPGGINGFDVLREFKSHPALAHIPVLMLTNLDSERQTAMDCGAASYIVKSALDIQRLPDIIAEYLPEADSEKHS